MRPSSLPILALSPKFESFPKSFAEEGTDRHAALQAHFGGDDTLLNLLDEESQAGVKWAAEYIRLVAPMTDHPVIWETPIKIELSDFTEMTGHPDAVCHTDIFDFKWRERDYTAQMAAYALGRLQALNFYPGATIRCHLLFGATKRKVILEFNAAEAEALIASIMAKVNEAASCVPSDYCGWCKHCVDCPDLTARSKAVAAGREDWRLEQYHVSEIHKPEEMAKALNLARHLKKWIEAVEHFAMEMVIKQGATLPGWTLKTKAGKRTCSDLQGAFEASGLSIQAFLDCCDLRFSDSKATGKPGIEGAYFRSQNVPNMAAAKRELKTKLDPFIQNGEPTKYLSKDKDTETEPF